MGSVNLFIIFMATFLQIFPKADANVNKLLCYDSSKDGQCHVNINHVNINHVSIKKYSQYLHFVLPGEQLEDFQYG